MRQSFVISSLILSGVCRSFISKILIQLGFDSPLLLTLGIFLGMFLCLLGLLPAYFTSLTGKGSTHPIDYTQVPSNDCKSADDKDKLVSLDPLEQLRGISIQTLVRIAIPACCDIFATVLNFIALLWLPAAINEVLRNGSEVVATAIIMVIFHGQVVTPIGWASIALSSIGLMLLSGGLFVGDSTGGNAVASHNILIGILITIPRSIASASQNYADQLLVHSLKLCPIVVVGLEGLVGVLLCLLAWPFVQILSLEDVNSACVFLFFSRLRYQLNMMYFLFLVAVALSNYFNVSLVAATGALTKEVWCSLRPPIIWVFSLVIYSISDQRVGERWDEREGVVRMLGILLVTSGIVGYTYQSRLSKLNRENNLEEKSDCLATDRELIALS